ncbi:type II toxin-antitoxin system RelE/ParE family toxin [Mangrovicella endophytica]|uniref:type II toxin-antitoxin system RelE/ParE family toxin n=1 Tax=Mangrovicella endophytica TaxID=2066697 RepID=UPI000C9E66E6|nr:type II toxin-antitoxin system RelE/ParE family toxin [Mangrovicella endophytica]
MTRYTVRLTAEAEAEADLLSIYRLVRHGSRSPVMAKDYLARIEEFLARFETFPARGTARDDISPGLRIVGFERRVSIAFVVEQNEVVILRILYAGRQDPRWG